MLTNLIAIAVAASATAQLDSLFEARYPEGLDAPGAAVIIAQGDSIIYERYFGTADFDTHQPITADTRFNIASISKQMTVVGLLQQDVDLESTVTQWFDYPQPFWKEITLEHLASHTSGIPDTRDRSDRRKCVFANDDQSISYMPTVAGPQFNPGSAYDYLNPSFILLARVIEQVTGTEFTDYQQKHIFTPAGMTNTYYFDPEVNHSATAHGYVPAENGKWAEYDYGEETFFATRPDGGVYSTARDMLNWELALEHGLLLPATKLARAYSPVISVSDSQWCDYQRRPNTWYGLGWFVDTTPRRPVKVYHTGDNGGFQAYVAKYPETGLKIIVLENRNDRDRWQMAQDIDRIMLGDTTRR